MPLLPWKPGWYQSHILQEYWSARCGKVAATASTPIAGYFTPGTFPNQIQAACKELWLVVVANPRAYRQLLQKYLMLAFLLLLCVTDSPSHSADITIYVTREFTLWMLSQEVLCMHVSSPMKTWRHEDQVWSLLFKILKRVKSKSRPLLKWI